MENSSYSETLKSTEGKEVKDRAVQEPTDDISALVKKTCRNFNLV